MNESEKNFPAPITTPLTFPPALEAEIIRAKAIFRQRYQIDPESTQPAYDPLYDYPLNWWDLMEFHLYEQMMKIQAACSQQQAFEQMAKEREAYMLQEQQAAADELAFFAACQKKINDYSGKESKLETGLFLPCLGGYDFFEIASDVIRLAGKFGYQTPLTDEELKHCRSLLQVDSSHGAFEKYAAELLEDAYIDITTIVEWEYQGANDFLSALVPAGFYCAYKQDYGWGVFAEGAFEGEEPY